MQISTVNSFVDQNQNLKGVAETKKYAERALNNSSEALKREAENNSSKSVATASKSDSAVYTTSEINQGGITQASAAGQNPLKKGVSKDGVSESPSVTDIAEEAALSIIPVYGTIRQFQKGNIGWGIFGLVTDALTLVPIIGAPVKAAVAAIRGGEAAVQVARAGLAAGEIVADAAHAGVAAGEIAAHAGVAADAASKLTAEASASLAKSAEDTGEAALRVVASSDELLYESGTFAGQQTTKTVTDTTSAAAKSAGVLENAARWKEANSTVHASETASVLHNDTDLIKSALEPGKYKIDGTVIPRNSPGVLEEAIPGIRERQLSFTDISGTPYSDSRIKELLSPNLYAKYIPQTVFNDSVLNDSLDAYAGYTASRMSI